MDYPILNHIIIVLSLVLAISLIFRYLHLPQILGYLMVGALVGPHGVGLIKNVADAHQLAGFGVVFLMFTVGLEFSLSRMRALHRAVVFLGGLQVLLTSLVGLFIGMGLLHLTWYAALILGGIVAMSSTAITVKQLYEQMELYTAHGQNAVGVLLFQDLAVIPYFILIASLGFMSKQPAIIHTLFLAIFKGVLALFIIFFLGKWLFRRLFHAIAATHVIELFTLAVLLVTLASAWLSENFGLSFALGAFLAGMMLSETKFRHQIEVEIRPFRDVLLGLFFITIGMLLNITSWKDNWLWIIILFSALLLVKITIVFLLSIGFRNDRLTSMRTALILAQGGEFGFAMLTLALTNQIFPPHYGQTILGALLLSFGFAPLLITYNRQLAALIFPKRAYLSASDAMKKISSKTGAIKDHVIICGYGRIGQSIAALLDQEKITYIALDLDPERIREASLAGRPVSYGDATHPGLLKAAGIMHAKTLVISFDDPHAAVKVLQHANNMNAKLPTMVRCKDEAELAQLNGQSATQIVVETQEESLSMIYHLLRTLRVPQAKVLHIIENIRRKHYAILRQTFPGTFTEESTEEGIPLKQLRPIILLKETEAIQTTLGDLTKLLDDVEVVAVRRGKDYYSHPRSDFTPAADDVVILYGTPENLEKAEEVFLTLPQKH